MKKLCLFLLLGTVLTAQSGPQVFPPTAEQRQAIDAKLADLTSRVNALAAKKTDPALLADVDMYRKAADYILRFPEEFFGKNYAAETITVLDTGIARAKELEAGTSSWAKAKGTLARGYVSRVDGSVQPYGLTIPASYDGSKPMRLDIWLHGTQQQLNEVRFLVQQAGPHETSQIQTDDYIMMEPFGRMNHSYRYYAETDVFEAIASVQKRYNIDPKRILIRGHSMGGQGAWRLGLQHPGYWAALEASAGYVDTHEYAKSRLPKEGLTPYQEATLSYYDAQDYALNAFDIPTVGYGGEQDAQLRASVKIREALGKEGFKFTQESPFRWTTTDLRAIFLVGPMTGHAWHKDTKVESEAFLRKALAETAGKAPNHLRCVTYTARFNDCHWISMNALDESYKRAEVDATRTDDMKKITVTTKNLSRIKVTSAAASYTLDGQTLSAGANPTFEKVNGKWTVGERSNGLRKVHGMQGPIEDALLESFVVVRGTGQPWNAAATEYTQKRFDLFKFQFAKWMRGDIRVKDDKDVTAADIANSNLILFGDPGSNSLIAKVMGKLPIQWSKSEITVGAQKFPAANNAVVMIYPNPLNPQRYVVLNTGHTFNADRNAAGSESMFFPRLGDYAVLAADGSTVTGGLFDESWKLK